MAKFNIGDKVRILDGSKIKNYVGGWCPESMAKFVGEVHTIKYVTANGGGTTGYTMEDTGFTWDERGLQLVESRNMQKQKQKRKFKVGDKIIANKKASARYGYTKEGWIGMVTDVYDPPLFGDEFRAVGLSDEDDDCRFGLEEKYFDLLKETIPETIPQKIVVTSDGKRTTAKLYDGKNLVKTATASCAPEDKFDFNYGAALAIERLTEGVLSKAVLNSVYGMPKETDWEKFLKREVIYKVKKNDINDFLKKCEDAGIVWGSGDKPTEWKTNEWNTMDEVLFFCTDNILTWDNQTCTSEASLVVDWKKSIDDKSEESKSEKFLNCRILIINNNDSSYFKSGKTYEVKDGKFVPTTVVGQMPYSGRLRTLDDLTYYLSSVDSSYGLPHSDNIGHHCTRGVEYKVIPPFDWNKFAHGELEVKVNKENFDEFMKQCKAKNFNWKDVDGADASLNPWQTFEALNPTAKAFCAVIGAVPGEYIWVSFDTEDDRLTWSSEHDEDVDEYEFI